MLFIILQKMLRNKWMVICLLLGSIIAVAMISSIPVYTSGILQRMLTKDLENHQVESGQYPGTYYAEQFINSHYKEASRTEAYLFLNNKLTDGIIADIKTPSLVESQVLTNENYRFKRIIDGMQIPEGESENELFVDLKAISNSENMYKIIYGKRPSGEMQNGLIEVMVTEEAMQKLDLLVDNVYEIYDFKNLKDPFKVKITGVFTLEEASDVFWFEGLSPYGNSFIMDSDLFISEFIESDSDRITYAQWYYAFDYTKIGIDDLDRIVRAFEEHSKWKADMRSIKTSMPAIDIMMKYNQRSNELKIILWVLQVPIILMLIFYMYIMSKLMIDFEKNEISVMQSRGAKSSWIFKSYLLQSVIMSLLAIVPGLLLGLFLTRFIGASNGFLQFVQRTGLNVKLNKDASIYAVIISCISILAMIVPAYKASKINIIEHKMKKTRFGEVALWKKSFIDIIMLGLSIYGLYSYQIRQETLEVTGAEGTQLIIDPLLFLSSTFFVIGCGLLFLRLYPYIMKLIYFAGKKIWSPPIFAGFKKITRSQGQEQFLMLFLILTISIGIFNAITARTINSNINDKAYYFNGADITLQEKWGNNLPPESDSPAVGITGGAVNKSNEPIIYIEPLFEKFEKLEGVENAAKVLIKNDVRVDLFGKSINGVELMGIIPEQFGKVAWFRDGLLPDHWYNYLNLMASEPTAMLLSSSFKTKYSVKQGDLIKLEINNQGYIEGIVYAFFDYWPTFNPNILEDGKKQGYLVVANLPYIYMKQDIEPYEIWMKKDPNSTRTQIFEDIKEKEIEIEKISDVEEQIIIEKNDPMLQGTNGSMTLGFVVAMGISILGFLIYWIISIKKRAILFGLFRSMGMSKSGVIKILFLEQLLVSGTAMIMGVVIGGICSKLFVPLLQITKSAAEQVPPYNVVAKMSDYVKVYSVSLAMLVIGIVILGVITSKIKLHQAIKLGED